MSKRRYFVLTIPNFIGDLAAVFSECHCPQPRFLTTLPDLSGISDLDPGTDILIAYSTGVIVPASLIPKFLVAYNFHAASPDFPGRDPHHFAIYRGAKSYGATAHYLTDKVDAGQIVGVESFAIGDQATPKKLLDQANKALLELFRKLLPEINSSVRLPSLEIAWGKTKTTRGEFQKMCTIPPDISAEELERRIRAFSSEGYRNLVVELHGRRFVLED